MPLAPVDASSPISFEDAENVIASESYIHCTQTEFEFHLQERYNTIMRNTYAPILALATIAIVAAIIGLFQFPADRIPGDNPIVEPVHYHAAFRIYKDGLEQDYSDIKYMSLQPCTDETEEHDESENEDTIHLHDLVGDVIHVHASDHVWGDVFKYLKLATSADTTAYNGSTPIKDPLESPIRAYQSVTFFIGDEPADTEKQAILDSAPEKDYIVTKEKKSENCGTP